MRTLKEIAGDLDSLSAQDFDWNNPAASGTERLQRLCDELLVFNDVSKCAPLMFAVMERLDTSDLGSPGPLVHTMEKWRGGYETFLAESLRRKPSPLTVWMINRILNGKPRDADSWLALLQSVQGHPNASEKAKQYATNFLDWQAGRARS